MPAGRPKCRLRTGGGPSRPADAYAPRPGETKPAKVAAAFEADGSVAAEADGEGVRLIERRPDQP